MSRICYIIFAVFLMVGVAISGSDPTPTPAPAQKVSPLILVQQIPLPGVVGRIDHIAVDEKHKRLFVSALGNNTVEVVDPVLGRSTHTISGLDQPKGIAYASDFDQLFIVNDGDNSVRIYDNALSLRKSIPLGHGLDFLHYEPISKKIFVASAENGGEIVVIDPATDERVETIKTDGEPEDFVVEASGSHVYANVPKANNSVESVDRKTGEIQKWPIGGVTKNVAMALNEADHRIFLVSYKPPLLVVVSSQTGQEVTRLVTGAWCRDLYFDKSRKRIYAMGGQGFVSVFQQLDPDHFGLMENVPSSIGAATGTFYVKRDRLDVPVPATGNDPARLLEFDPQ